MKHIDKVTLGVARKFKCFGGGEVDLRNGNPLSAALADGPIIFALGVSVKDVVRFVVNQQEPLSDAQLLDEVQRRGLVAPECNARGGA